MRHLRGIKIGILFFFVILLSGCSPGEEEFPSVSLDTNKESIQREEESSRDEMKTQENARLSIHKEEKSMKQYEQAPEMQIDEKKSYQATLQTEKGDIVISLYASEVPVTVNNFVFLSKEGFYDGSIFHRALKGFMIQGGDPTGTGMGGPGYRFDDEVFSGEYTRGVVAMANAGPNTNGSQFFIMHADTPLPPNYVIFGEVIEGMGVVDSIAEAPVGMSDSGEPSSPLEPIAIQTVILTEE